MTTLFRNGRSTAWIALGAFAWATSACSSAPGGVAVQASSYGERWPLTVSEGLLECEAGAVLFTSGGTTYAVNGTARGRKRWPDIDPLVRRQNLDSGRGMVVVNASVSPLIDDGLRLCSTR